MTTLGNKPYTIKYAKDVVKKDIPNLPKTIKSTIKLAIEERIAQAPLLSGKPLRHSWKGHRRVRVSDYQIIYRLDETIKCIFIVAIKHRKHVYKFGY